MPNLSALTACLWMKATDTNSGTPLGYAVPGQDNEFIIYNYKSFMLFVGGNYRSVKMPIYQMWGQDCLQIDVCLMIHSPENTSRIARSLSFNLRQDCVRPWRNGCFWLFVMMDDIINLCKLALWLALHIFATQC